MDSQKDRRGDSMAGWMFSDEECKDAIQCSRLLNPSIDFSNACNLNCAYCFSEKYDSHRKITYENELSYKQLKSVIDDFVAAGAKTINVVGSGEPTIYKYFVELIYYIFSLDVTPVVFTNGIMLYRNYGLINFLQKVNASVVIKLNSMNHEIQDLLAGRKGYTKKRDWALEALIDAGFNAHKPTRIGADIIVMSGVMREIPDMHRFCRNNNIFPIITDYIPSGRCIGGNIDYRNGDGRKEVSSLMDPLNNIERAGLYKELKKIDRKEYKISHDKNPAYYSGVSCRQRIGLYVDILGDIWPCVAKSNEIGLDGRSFSLGNINNGDFPSWIWKNNGFSKKHLSGYTGGCIYKNKFYKSS